MAKFENDIRVCPWCGEEQTPITHATGTTQSGYFFRVRECRSCGEKWRTYEVHSEAYRKAYWALEGVKKLAEKYGGDPGL